MLFTNLTATLLLKKEKYYLNNEKSQRLFEVSNENKNHNSSVTRNWVITDKREVDGTLILLPPPPPHPFPPSLFLSLSVNARTFYGYF